MDRASAERLLKQALEQPFEEARFQQMVRNLVNDLDESDRILKTWQGNYIKDAYKEQVRQYKRLGQYTDPDDNVIDVLWVRLKKITSLDRARTMQRNFIAQYLQDRGTKDAALVAYSADDSEDWRFSFVRVDYRLEQKPDGTYKPKKEVTAARRASFLVGANEPSHTAQQQLLPLLLNDRENPGLDELEETFSIESVTKEFFEKYKKLFLRVNDELEALLEADPIIKEDFTAKQINLANFAKKFLGQIVFLYFLQKKGWLGVEPGQDWGRGPKKFLRQLFDRSTSYENFFNDVLEHLFYEALAMDRGPEALYSVAGQEACKIPFLNGGLFEPIGGYDWRKTNILIENDTVQDILDTFDLYNFTVREDEPLDKEVAVDPEMLGKVFENLLEVKDRKSKGAFYTPREIVHYMCQESLINYLDTTVNMQTIEVAPAAVEQTSLFETEPAGQLPLTKQEYREQVPRQDLEQLIRQGERAIENDVQVVQRGVETQTYQYRVPESVRQYAVDIDQALADIKICDPAIGSGAFPVGMMQEIVKARGVLSTYLPDENRTAYAFKRHAIQASIYGVDIDAGAVDIAKLRLWLSLVVDEEDYGSIKPLPNLDYKIVCGNSLLNVEKNLFNHEKLKILESRKQKYFEETNVNRKLKLKTEINTLISNITNQDTTFDFEVYFSEVFQKRDGFDVVIANPPYLGQKGNKNIFQEIKTGWLKEFYIRNADLLYFFFHLALNLCAEQGVLCFITTNYFLTADGAVNLRKDLKKRAFILNFLNFNEFRIFKSALGQHNIITLAQKQSKSDKVKIPKANVSIVSATGNCTEKALKKIITGQHENTISYITEQHSLYEGNKCYMRIEELSISKFKELRVDENPENSNLQDIISILQQESDSLLIDICAISRGVETGADKVKPSHIKKGLVDSEYKGHGIYVLSAEEIKRINPGENEKEIIKPFFKNSDISRFYCSEKAEKFLIYVTREISIESFPNIYRHLLIFEKVIKSRSLNRGEIQAAAKLGKWWVLFSAKERSSFVKKKIVCPQRSPENTFAYTEVEWYSSADVYYLTQKDNSFDLRYILGLLNSSVYKLWLATKGKRKGKLLELYYTPLTQIPIKKVASVNQKQVIDLVDEILELKKSLEVHNDPKINTLISEAEKRIDMIVCKNHGLEKYFSVLSEWSKNFNSC